MSGLKRYKTLIKIALSAVILFFLIRSMDFGALKATVHTINFMDWIWSCVLVIAQILLISFRWNLLVNLGGKIIPVLEAVRITVLSLIANLLFITSIGGIVVRVALSVRHGASFSSSLLSTLFDRMMTLGALLLISAILFFQLKPYVSADIFSGMNLFFLGVVTAGLLGLPLLFKGTYSFSVFRYKKIAPVADYCSLLFTNPLLLIKVIGLSLLAQSAYILSVVIIVLDAAGEIPLLPLIALLPAIMLIASMPVGFGGWGIREGAFVYGLALLGVPMETAFLISVQVGVIGIIATIVMGLPALLTEDGFDSLKLGTFHRKKENT